MKKLLLYRYATSSGANKGFPGFAAAHQAPSERFNVPPPDALLSEKRRRLFRDVVASSEAGVVDNAPLLLLFGVTSYANMPAYPQAFDT